ncbi:MAG: methyltransferase [Pseudomonadota bacterium]
MAFSADEISIDAFLGGRLSIRQPKTGYRAATDPVLLAAACPAQIGESVLDLGCGVGTAGLCLARRIDVSVTGLELQGDYAALARDNATANEISMDVIEGDLAQMPPALRDRSFDHVITNPPFFAHGTKANDAGRARARQEAVGLPLWIDSGLRRLKPKGWLTLILTIDRLPEVIVSLNERAGSLKIKPLSARAGRPAGRFLLCARKGGRAPTTLYNPLILHEGSVHEGDFDSYTKEARSVLREAQVIDF